MRPPSPLPPPCNTLPQVYNAVRWKLPMDDYPTIRRIHEACEALPAFQRAAPEAQPDAPATV